MISIEIFRGQKGKDTCLLVLFSLLMLSPFGMFKLLSYQGKYIAEIGVILLVAALIIRKRLFWVARQSFKNKIFLVASLVWLILFFIGLAFHGDLLSAYSDLRVHVIITGVFCFFFLCKRKDIAAAENALILLSFSSLAFYLAFLLTADRIGQGVKYVYPSAAYLVLLLLMAKRGWVFGWLGSVALCAVCAATSFYRGQWVLAGLAILISAIFFFKAHGFSALQGAVKVTAVIIISTSLFGSSVYSALMDYLYSSESSYIHSIGKLNGLITSYRYGGLQEGDDLRMTYFTYIIKNFVSLMFPAGLGYDAQIGNVHSVLSPPLSSGTTIDSFFLFALVHYGFFSMPLFALLIGGLLARLPQLGFFLLLAIFVWFSFYAAISGAFMTELSLGFFVAAAIGIIMNSDFWCVTSER